MYQGSTQQGCVHNALVTTDEGRPPHKWSPVCQRLLCTWLWRFLHSVLSMLWPVPGPAFELFLQFKWTLDGVCRASPEASKAAPGCGIWSHPFEDSHCYFSLLWKCLTQAIEGRKGLFAPTVWKHSSWCRQHGGKSLRLLVTFLSRPGSWGQLTLVLTCFLLFHSVWDSH